MVEDSPRVLIVDDDDVIRNLLGELLDGEGYAVEAAANGKEALAVLQRWRPDTILLDLMMPKMDGWRFRAEQQRRADVADVPVVILSAAHELERHAATLGAAAVVRKPFELDILLDTLARLTMRTPDQSEHGAQP